MDVSPVWLEADHPNNGTWTESSSYLIAVFEHKDRAEIFVDQIKDQIIALQAMVKFQAPGWAQLIHEFNQTYKCEMALHESNKVWVGDHIQLR